MSIFLFARNPAAGHLNPLLSIGGRLRDDGHTVIFSSYGPGRVAAIVETEGFRFIPVRPAPSSVRLLVLPSLNGYAETFSCGKLPAVESGILCVSIRPSAR